MAALRARRGAATVRAGEVVADVQMGSATARTRRADKAWMVRLCRPGRAVVIAVGLTRPQAEHLATQVNDLLRP
jgi:hypothetical protein